MEPREQLSSVPFAIHALDVSGAINWTNLPLATGFHSPPNSQWQKAQYQKIGDIVYLRGIITIDSGNIASGTEVATLPTGFRPPKNLAFPAEPHNRLVGKHRVDILPSGVIRVDETAGATPHISLDGILFSTSQ